MTHEEQPTLAGMPALRRRRRAAPPGALAELLPVAEVVVDRSQPHLDHVFEYAVPQSMAQAAQPGVRVKVRFGGQDLDGFVVARTATAEHAGTLAPLRKVVSAEVVLTPEVLGLARAVAARYAGTVTDVLRLAVPPRHARVEQEAWRDAPPAAEQPGAEGTAGPAVSEPSAPAAAWAGYRGGEAFWRRVAGGQAPRAVWLALPGPAGQRWCDAVASAVAACRSSGRGALVVVPSAADVDTVLSALETAGVPRWQPGMRGGWVRLVADDGPSARYRAFLALSRGHADVAVGTRAAAFAPVDRLGLAVCWDDGDTLHAEPRAPGPHARETLALRSAAQAAALLVGGYTRSVATQRWLATGWAQPLVAGRDTVRARTPRIAALTSVELAREGAAAAARLPGAAWRALKDGLARGPVLVQVPRAGYLPAVACGRCRTLARCGTCSGPLHVADARSGPACRWCGRLATGWACPECSATTLRSVRVGSDRTAEELGRAFAGVPVRLSGASTGVVAAVDARPVLVVATPGAEPVAEGGYAAAVLLDAAVVTGRPGLETAVEALGTWLAAAALVRPAREGGVVLLVGDGAPVPTQALVRWDPAGLAERELVERAELQLPPAVHLVAVEGSREAVEAVVAGLADDGTGTTVLGPIVLPDGEDTGAARLDGGSLRPVRALVRTPWPASAATTARLAAAVAVRSARREAGPLRVRVEPTGLL